MPIHAILFDLDGTLLDTLEDIANAANRVLAARGFPIHPCSESTLGRPPRRRDLQRQQVRKAVRCQLITVSG